ncbi:MAG: hypothetical protein Fur0025_15750 [Oscillatoriaceae cyanobacterium]
MTALTSLSPYFLDSLPRLAQGKYIHFILLRHSQSFPVLQTDGVLNTARTQAGIKTSDTISRLVMFKRKQTTPERLAGRELLRSLNITSGNPNDNHYCEYNGEDSCKQCPDCILYGFAIGNSGSQRSKVYSDSAFSLSPYEQSHRSFTFNAPFEGGTMSEGSQMRNAINEQDHILPEVTFPTVETIRDVTQEAFVYILGNLLRTRRYGAQESRTGTMQNHLVGILFCDGEIFSNLHLTQNLYDALKSDLNAPIADIKNITSEMVQRLVKEEPVRISKQIFGDELDSLVAEVTAIYQDEASLLPIITNLAEQAKSYSEIYGAKSDSKKKKK